jgi:cellulose synthase/poly-beta-1,6-N-acetylglucosamine synthase-like glycosyltransferase
MVVVTAAAAAAGEEQGSYDSVEVMDDLEKGLPAAAPLNAAARSSRNDDGTPPPRRSGSNGMNKDIKSLQRLPGIAGWHSSTSTSTSNWHLTDEGDSDVDSSENIDASALNYFGQDMIKTFTKNSSAMPPILLHEQSAPRKLRVRAPAADMGQGEIRGISGMQLLPQQRPGTAHHLSEAVLDSGMAVEFAPEEEVKALLHANKNESHMFSKQSLVMQTLGVGEGYSFKVKKDKMPDPQEMRRLHTSYLIQIIALLNVGAAAWYLWWRALFTFEPRNEDGDVVPMTLDQEFFFTHDGKGIIPVIYWMWIFYGVECCLALAVLIGHTEKMFAVSRPLLRMDDLVSHDLNVGFNARVAMLIPTAGERLDIVLLALVGAMSQCTWKGGISRSGILRIVVLDEKRRIDILRLCAGVYEVSSLCQDPEVRRILRIETFAEREVSCLSFFNWFKAVGEHKRALFSHSPKLQRACDLLKFMLILTETSSSRNRLADCPGAMSLLSSAFQDMLTKHGLDGVDKVDPGLVFHGNDDTSVPMMIYYARVHSGTPKCSPKAGNMNAAMFSQDHPDMEPAIGKSTIVVVNDCRHQPQPEFLQRTVPYFFALNQESKEYMWGNVAFVQTPQKFTEGNLDHDPLGNHAAAQYDVINHGKDGKGAVSSSGHGSLWRVEAMMGTDVNGKVVEEVRPESIGHGVGFASEILIEDTHTSIQLFKRGWRSVYVNEPGEDLSKCTHQPNSIAWRVKQLLRWHQGAAQLLLTKGITYTSIFGKFPTIWHRIYGFDQATYFLQSIPAYILLLMPVIYGATNSSPFFTSLGDFFQHFTPYIVTALLPGVIAAITKGVDPKKLERDEQIWMSTTYLQFYAFTSTLWATITRASADNAWTVKAPTWPL